MTREYRTSTAQVDFQVILGRQAMLGNLGLLQAGKALVEAYPQKSLSC